MIRTIYIGNVPQDTPISKVLDHICTGNMLPGMNCAFITFVDPKAAYAFHKRAKSKKHLIGKNELKIGWGAATPVSVDILEAMKRGVSRCVFIGAVDETVTIDTLTRDLSKFGMIEDIKIIRDQAVAFVHFTHIAIAMNVVARLRLESDYSTTNTLWQGSLCKPKRHIAFITFADPAAASSFLEHHRNTKLIVGGHTLKVDWGQKANTLPIDVIRAFSTGATRNVFINGVEGVANEERLREDFSEFGDIEHVNIYERKNCGFVNLTDILKDRYGGPFLPVNESKPKPKPKLGAGTSKAATTPEQKTTDMFMYFAIFPYVTHMSFYSKFSGIWRFV
ncbi:hypothetical protein BGZ76_001721 [Entomortierella beljakovae]|nr:hypothetical protein BGZ76_001721 [Entomortierella beljakovae]